MGSASQCSKREEGGSRWPYLVPALGGSRGGKKYLRQRWRKKGKETDKYIDGGSNKRNIQGKHIKGNRNEKLKGELMHVHTRNNKGNNGRQSDHISFIFQRCMRNTVIQCQWTSVKNIKGSKQNRRFEVHACSLHANNENAVQSIQPCIQL